MTEKEKNEARKMLQQGYSYGLVAAEFGISRQRLNVMFKDEFKGRKSFIHKNREYTARKYVTRYPNIDEWLYTNRHTMSSFAKLCGVTQPTIHHILYSENTENVTKGLIDKILKTTGMTYEIAFKEIRSNP